MYEYKEKTHSTSKLEKRNTTRRNFFDTSKSAQFKFADEDIHNKLVQCFSEKPVIQLEKMDAGDGNFWHIHKGHIKYGSNNGTRINFHNNDTAADIINRLNEVLQAYPGLQDKPGLQECIKWINDYC